MPLRRMPSGRAVKQGCSVCHFSIVRSSKNLLPLYSIYTMAEVDISHIITMLQNFAKVQQDENRALKDKVAAMEKELAALKGVAAKDDVLVTTIVADDPSTVFDRCLAKLEKADIKESETPLLWAARNNDLELLEFLTANGHGSFYDVNTCDKETSLTALHYAASHGNLDMVKFLLEKGIRAKDTDPSGDAAIHTAIRNGHFEVVKYFLSRLKQDMLRIDDMHGKLKTECQVAKEANQPKMAALLRLHGSKEER